MTNSWEASPSDGTAAGRRAARSLPCTVKSLTERRRVVDDCRQTHLTCHAFCVDLEVTSDLIIPATELRWKFSRSSGPGGQHVNTSDSRVQLTWMASESSALTDEQRMRIVHQLAQASGSSAVTVTVSEQRSQLRNREIALKALREIVAAALTPPPPLRRATRPTRGSERRRFAYKQQRSATKRQRRRPINE